MARPTPPKPKYRYFRAEGEAKRLANEHIKAVNALSKKRLDFAKKFGSLGTVTYDEYIGGIIPPGLSKEQADNMIAMKLADKSKIAIPKGWRLNRDGFLVPALSTKEGKAIEKEMQELREPTPDAFAKALGLKSTMFFSGLWMCRLSIMLLKKKIYTMVPATEKFKPTKDAVELKCWEFAKVCEEAGVKCDVA